MNRAEIVLRKGYRIEEEGEGGGERSNFAKGGFGRPRNYKKGGMT